jgi:hypothetical protein
MPFNRRYTIDGATSLQQDWAPLPTNSIEREREGGIEQCEIFRVSFLDPGITSTSD